MLPALVPLPIFAEDAPVEPAYACAVCGEDITAAVHSYPRQRICLAASCVREWRTATYRARSYGTAPEHELARQAEASDHCRICGERCDPRLGVRDTCETCNGTRRAKRYRTARRDGLSHDEAVIASADAPVPVCRDCGANVVQVGAHPPHRCPFCRRAHDRAIARAKRSGRSVEDEKARGVDPHCDVCGEPLTNLLRRRCESCSRGYQRARHRAWRYGTSVAEEREREQHAACRICGQRPSHINKQWCDDCTDTGRVKVYRRARAQYAADHDTAVLLSAAVECAICAQPLNRRLSGDSGAAVALCIDHDHDTGRIRGALCGHCNRTLGWMRDDTAMMLRAIGYLRGDRSVSTDDAGVVRSVGLP